MQNFGERLANVVRAKKTPAIVGIDPRAELLPQTLVTRHGLGSGASERVWARAVDEFGSRVLDVVAPWVPAVKFQSAFFEVHHSAGVAALQALMHKARRIGLLTILDAKRGDIGSTSEAYAEAAFGKEIGPVAGVNLNGAAARGADALTVSPYLGRDSLDPFLKFSRDSGRGLFVLVRTSNPGARDLQQLTSGPANETVYRHVAGWVREWSRATRGPSGFGAVGAVVGGTAGDQIAELRTAMPDSWLLIPGYGTQGATAADIAGAFDDRGLGAVVNNSRGILFPKTDGDGPAGAWEADVESALKRMIEDLALHTPAGRLCAR